MRSKKTARSKGYAFVEFEDKEVSKVAAESMNQYLMYGKFLDCRLLTDEEFHENQFKRSEKKFKFVPWHIIYKNHMNNEDKSDEKILNGLNRLVKNDQERIKKLTELGIEYQFKPYNAL